MRSACSSLDNAASCSINAPSSANARHALPGTAPPPALLHPIGRPPDSPRLPANPASTAPPPASPCARPARLAPPRVARRQCSTPRFRQEAISMPALTTAEVDSRLSSRPGWTREGDEIRKQFTFRDFRQAMAFVNRVADAANTADHHPDITINYNRVTMSLSTHSEGGVTQKDFDLAAAIDAAAG